MDTADVGQLLALISHEVQNPLGVMRGYLRLLDQRGPELSESHRFAITGALKASDRAVELLAQISLVAQLARQETPFNFQPAALSEVVADAVAAVVLPEDLRITLDMTRGTPVEVRADWNLLRLALTALISAVVRAQPSDASLIIGTTTQQRPGSTDAVEMGGADAVTLAAESASSVDRFRHDALGVVISVEVATADGDSEHPLDITRGGLGLDLPMAAALVAAHGGAVRERRNGARLRGVVVWLPLAE